MNFLTVAQNGTRIKFEALPTYSNFSWSSLYGMSEVVELRNDLNLEPELYIINDNENILVFPLEEDNKEILLHGISRLVPEFSKFLVVSKHGDMYALSEYPQYNKNGIPFAKYTTILNFRHRFFPGTIINLDEYIDSKF